MSKSKARKEPLKVVLGTDEDLERFFGPSRLVFGFPVRPESESQHPMTSEEVTEGDGVSDTSTYACGYCEHTSVGSAAAKKHVEDCHPENATDGVTYLGHREVPESEQQWEIHLQPKHDGSPKGPSPDTGTLDIRT